MRIITQVLDGAYGKPAAGINAHLACAIEDGWAAIADATTNYDGIIDEWNSRHLERGLYRIVFDCDSYFACFGVIGCYPEIIVVFRVQDDAPVFQLQVTLAPHAYSAYFGPIGASPGSPG